MADEFVKGQQFNLVDLYRNVFGYKGVPFPAGGISINPNLRGKVDALISGTKFSDQSGVIEPFEVEGDFAANAANGARLFMPIKLNGIQLQNEPLVELRGKKIIKKTNLTGEHRQGVTNKRGSVKELINIGDYKITIRGIVINEDSERYPETEMRVIRKIIEERKSVEIQCLLTTIFNISLIAIEDSNFPVVPGMQHAQAYEIIGYSDEDFETELISQLG
jgi:hypothetical protein